MPYQWNPQQGNNGQYYDPNLAYGMQIPADAEMQEHPMYTQLPVSLGPGRAGGRGGAGPIPTSPFNDPGVAIYQPSHLPPQSSPVYQPQINQHHPQFYPQQQPAAYHCPAAQQYATAYSDIHYQQQNHMQPLATPQHFHQSPLQSHIPLGQLGLLSTHSDPFVQSPQPSQYVAYGQARSPSLPTQSSTPAIFTSQTAQQAAPQQLPLSTAGCFAGPVPGTGGPTFNGSSASPIMPKKRTPQQPRVEIPIQAPLLTTASQDRPQSIKRRRSNEGHAIFTGTQELKQTQQKPKGSKNSNVSLPSQDLSARRPSKLSSTQKAQQNTEAVQPYQTGVDYQTVLHGLTNEYLAAAYQMDLSATAAEDIAQYQSLVAMAMRCLQSSLANYRETDPRKEARVRLHLATLIAEETEDAEEAESILTKGIALCERSRLPDIKRTMQYVLIQQEFRTNPKRAFKTIENVIKEVETLRLTNWCFAFIMLYVSLAMQTKTNATAATLTKLLSSMSEMANEQHNISVVVLAACLQALVHISSSAAGAVSSAQSALAVARSHQLSPTMQQMPEVLVLLNCIDLACALLAANPDQIAQKMGQMQESLDSMPKASKDSKNGLFAVQLGASANRDLDIDTRGLMKRDAHGRATLALQWMSRNDIYVLGFVLSSIASVYANGSNSVKTLTFLEEGMKMMMAPVDKLDLSLPARAAQESRHAALSIAMQIQHVFAYTCRYEWRKAQECLIVLKQELSCSKAQLDEHTEVLVIYQEALCKHGLGDLDGALQIYTSQKLHFDPTSRNTFLKDLQALATLDRVLIIRSHSPQQSAAANDLLKLIEPYCMAHANKSIHAAWHAVTATADEAKSAIVKTKQHLQLAIQASKESRNSQILCIVMNVMSSLFFTNIVGVQAEKSVRAGRSLAKAGQGNLWLAVADGMYADNAMRSGRASEAQKAEQEAREALMSLPVLVREGVTTTLKLEP